MRSKRCAVQNQGITLTWCSLVQPGAVWSKLVQLGAVWCTLVQVGAV